MPSLSLAAIRQTLKTEAPAITVRKESDSEYRVTFTQDSIGQAFPEMDRAERIAKAESLAGYESDPEAALATGLAMARVGLTPAPAARRKAALAARDMARAAPAARLMLCGDLMAADNPCAVWAIESAILHRCELVATGKLTAVF